MTVTNANIKPAPEGERGCTNRAQKKVIARVPFSAYIEVPPSGSRTHRTPQINTRAHLLCPENVLKVTETGYGCQVIEAALARLPHGMGRGVPHLRVGDPKLGAPPELVEQGRPTLGIFFLVWKSVEKKALPHRHGPVGGVCAAEQVLNHVACHLRKAHIQDERGRERAC